MAVNENFQKMTCDRCQRTAFLEKTDPRVSNEWSQIQRMNYDSKPAAYLLCSDCKKLATQILVKHDSEWNTFMSSATTTGTEA